MFENVLTRKIIFIFGVLPATYFIPLIALVLIKATHGFDINEFRNISLVLWPIGGFTGVLGLWIIALMKKPPKVVSTVLLSAGILSVIYTFVFLGEPLSFATFSERPGFLLLFPPTIISIMYLFKSWSKTDT